MITDREEAIKLFPEAVWFVGDEATIGERVLHGNRRGTIIGLFSDFHLRRHPVCQTCTCPGGEDICKGWFIVKNDDGGQTEICYPPTLVMLERD